MAITLARELGTTGVVADYWVLVRADQHREGTTNDFYLSGTYKLWANAAAYAAGKDPIPNILATVSAGLITTNPTAGAMQSQLDAAAVAGGGALEGGVVS